MKAGIGKPVPGIATFGPEVHEDPYPWYDELRRTDPVHWDEQLGGWLVTRYDDAAHVLNDRHFSSSRVSLARERFRDPRWEPLFDVLKSKMSEQDDPDHKRVRALVNDAFARTAVEQWASTLEGRAKALVENAGQSNQLEFITEFAVPLPLLLILEIVGIPLEDRSRVKSWCDDFAVVALNYFASIRPEEMEKGLESTLRFRSYLVDRMAALRRSQQTDLLSSLVQAEREQHRLSVDEVLSNLLLLLSAGNETTTCLLSNGMAALLSAPDQMRLLQDDPGLIPNAIEEMLRLDSPVQYLGRIALEDVELGDKVIQSGQLVLPVLGAANRDPDKFDRPSELDVTRHPNHHLSFGHGIHFCAGAMLARLEAKIAFEAILGRYETIELANDRPLKHRPNFNIRCYEELPLRVT